MLNTLIKAASAAQRVCPGLTFDAVSMRSTRFEIIDLEPDIKQDEGSLTLDAGPVSIAFQDSPPYIFLRSL